MKLSVLLAALEISGHPDCEIGAIQNDTRRVREGDMFVAVSGKDEDGHDYIGAALEKGASFIISERPLSGEIPHTVVPDSKKALALLAGRFYGHPAEKLKMIGVTGTNGKTTTTHIIKGVLESVPGNIVGLIGTNYTLIGSEVRPARRTTPDAVSLHEVLAEMVEKGCTHCVMEVSSHALAQERVHGVQYQMGVFTNLKHEHLDYHRTMEEYFETKCRLFDQTAIGIVNADDEWGRRLLERGGFEKISYSEFPDAADVFAREVKLLQSAVEFEAEAWSQSSRFFWRTPGRFSVRNALAAICCGLVSGMPLPDISIAMRALPPVRGRMETVPVPGDFSVIIDYAHTPDALENALETARGLTKGRLIAVFGCGGSRDRTKRPIMGEIVSRLADVAVVTSDNPRDEQPGHIISDILAGMSGSPLVLEDRHQAIHAALRAARPGDTVLLCGKGHEEYQELMGEKHYMDERKIVAEFWGK